MQKMRFQLRALFYKEGEVWIAHCLEMDVMGHGSDKRKAFASMHSAIFTQLAASIACDNRANIFQPADARFFEMYAAGKDIADGECTVEWKKKVGTSDDVEIEAREYQGEYAVA